MNLLGFVFHFTHFKLYVYYLTQIELFNVIYCPRFMSFRRAGKIILSDLSCLIHVTDG